MTDVPGPERSARRAPDPGWTDGRSSRWVAHRARRREQLIDAAVTAVKTFGPDVGMDQIAAAAHTSKAVIYRYFVDKSDLYRAMGERIVGVIVRALKAVQDEPDARLVVRASIDAYLSLLGDNPELYHFVTGNRTLHESRPGEPTSAEYSQPIADLLAGTFARRLDRVGGDPAAARPWAEAVVGFIRSASLWWIDHRDAMTRDELTDHLTGLLWGGLGGAFVSASDSAAISASVSAADRDPTRADAVTLVHPAPDEPPTGVDHSP